MSAGAASWLKVGSLRIPLLAEANSVVKSRNGENTAVVPTPEVDSSTWTPLVPPVGNTIQPLFVRLPASHAATDEVTSNLCQPVATPGMAPSNPTPPTLVELHDDDANGRLVHVTVVCRKQAGAERDISAKGSQPGGAARGCEGSARLRGRRAHLIPWNGELAERAGVALVGHIVVEPGGSARHERGIDKRAQVELDQEGGRIRSDA